MQNFIVAENVNQADIEKALVDLSNLYSDTGFTNGIKLYSNKGKPNSFLILFSNNPDFERFNYFVNYLEYPVDVSVPFIFIKGFYQVSSIIDSHEFKKGNWIMVYVSKNQTENDNVNIVNELNESYLYDFGGRHKKLDFCEQKFVLISPVMESYNFIREINLS
ncbi:MAG TPA: hypothetical protein VK177_18635 [Flavobacteriales bacterium]|nr:hypothetical protein [Flavobacteriales bacterium]